MGVMPVVMAPLACGFSFMATEGEAVVEETEAAAALAAIVAAVPEV